MFPPAHLDDRLPRSHSRDSRERPHAERRFSGRYLLPLGLTLLGLSCVVDVAPDLDDPPWADDGDRRLERLVPSASTLTLAEGSTADLTLSAFYEGTAEPVVVTMAATWASSDPEVAAVTSSGTVTGLAEGRVIVFAMIAGVQSDPVTVTVGRVYSLVVDNGVARRGRLLELVLTSPDADFTEAESIDLSIPGLMPFGDDRTVDPWWGVVPGTTDSYEAVFLVPPTATLGEHEITFLLDGAPPLDTPTVEVQRNDALETLHGCDYFNDDSTSNWTFTANGTGSQARTWLVAAGVAGTLSRFSTRSLTSGDVDPWMALWSLDGDLLVTNEQVAGATTTDEAAIELTALQDDFEGAYFVTAAVSPQAVTSQAEGEFATACLEWELPADEADAVDGFPEGGERLLPGSTVKEFNFIGAGSAARVYVYIDIDLNQLPATTVRLSAPDGTDVDLINDVWADEVGVSSGSRWLGTVGAALPFTPTASEVEGGIGTVAFAGGLIAGTWTLEVDIQTAAEAGYWYGAHLWIELQ